MLSIGVLAAVTASLVKAVPAHWVLAVMIKMQPNNRPGVRETYDETAEAIAQASNANPIFAGEDGAIRTAALLLAIAHFESHFNTTAMGDNGHSFGLFQIQPPTAALTEPNAGEQTLTANALLLPRDAAPIAIKLIKTSMKICGDFGWSERLGWYAAGGVGCKEAGRKKSVPRMLLAQKIVKENPVVLLDASGTELATAKEEGAK